MAGGAKAYRVEFRQAAVGPEWPEWDAFVQVAVGGHHVQTSLWAQVKATVGWEPSWVVVRRGDRIVCGVQLLSRQVGRLGRVAYGAKGPLSEAADAWALDLLLRELDRFGREARIRYMKLQPSLGREDLVPSLCRMGWVQSAIGAAPLASVRLDLRQSEDDLLAGMDRTRRKLARNYERNGVVVRSGGESDMPLVYELLSATARRRGFGIFPRRYYEVMFRVFSRKQRAELLIAYQDGDPVAASLVLGYGDSARYMVGASSASTNARPMVALQWHGIRWAKACGYTWYDFEGISRPLAEALRSGGSLPADITDGVTRFKVSFGGRVELFPHALDRSPSPLLRPLVRLLAPRADRTKARRVGQRLLGLRSGSGPS